MGNVTPREAINAAQVLRLAVTLQCTAEWRMPKQELFKMELTDILSFHNFIILEFGSAVAHLLRLLDWLMLI